MSTMQRPNTLVMPKTTPWLILVPFIKKAYLYWFPTCQVRVSRFWQRCNSFLRFLLLLVSSYACSGCSLTRLGLNTAALDATGHLNRSTRHRECQAQCQKECPIECQNVCQIECQIECRIECKNILLDRMPDRMSDRMPDRMSNRMSEQYVGGNRSKLSNWFIFSH